MAKSEQGVLQVLNTYQSDRQICKIAMIRQLDHARALLLASIVGPKVLIVTNETVAPLYLSSCASLFEGKHVDVLILKDGERFKTFDSIHLIFNQLLTHQHHRDTTLVALGGGVINDMVGYAAATYLRGVSWISFPTTLLAQIDAAIGGKTGINFEGYKNNIGAFFHPTLVLIYPSYLSSLPLREYRAGLAEMVKYAYLIGGELFSLLKMNIRSLSQNPQHAMLPQFIAQCVDYKVSIVEQDPYETKGLRALLNLGHTLGHALESVTHFERWLHGEAVAIGLYCIALLSLHKGWVDIQFVEQLDLLLQDAGLPRRIPRDIDFDVLQDSLKRDKKICQQKLKFVLMKGVNNIELNDEVSEAELRWMYENALEGEQE